MIFMKAKPYPDGTIRSHGLKKFKKTDGGWIPVKEGMTESERAKAEADAQRSKKGKAEIKKIKGTKPIYEALHRIATAKEPFYLDDMKGKSKNIFNVLTKESLITWTHVAADEYKAELTESGKKAHDAGHAYFSKVKRESLSKPKSKVDPDVGPKMVASFDELFKVADILKKKA
jgi:hypothetical protein